MALLVAGLALPGATSAQVCEAMITLSREQASALLADMISPEVTALDQLYAFEELQWHLYATAVMFGTAYAQVSNLHVRVDLFYHKFSQRKQAIVDIVGLTFLAIPFAVVVILHSYDFAYESWRVNESSASPSGLPYRWLIKSVIPLSFSMLLLSMIARILRNIETLSKGADHGSK